MQIVLAILIAAGLVPIGLAIWHNRDTSLFHALVWAAIAWLTWGVAFLFGSAETLEPGRYCALCLTGCAGIAVLGARRPHVFAWNFVVLGLFAVMVLPLIETLIIGTHPVDTLRICFMAGTIAVGVLNYLPTRLAPAAFLLMLAGAGEIALLYVPAELPMAILDLLLAAVPWIGWSCVWQPRRDRTEFDREWLSFRDRWGLMWSQRIREQFNRAAENAGWPITLAWRGLTRATQTAADRDKQVETLRATLQRFLAQRPGRPPGPPLPDA
jgi:hypothetical protein